MKTLIVLSFLMITSACSTISDKNKEPVRKSGIPAEAFWVGGTNGGNWYFVEDVHSHRNNAVIRVYNDHDGTLIASKRFTLICQADNMIYIEDLQKQIGSFDGQRILLKSSNGKEPCFLQ